MAKGIARESEGAKAIFFDEIPQLKEQPALIQKSDGGFNYTTDRSRNAGRTGWKPGSRTRSFTSPTDGNNSISTDFRRVPPLAFSKRTRNSPTSGLVFDSRRGRQAVQNAFGRDGQARRLARRGRGTRPQSGRGKKSRLERAAAARDCTRCWQSARSSTPTCFESPERLCVQLGQDARAERHTAPYLLYAYARIRSIFRKAEGTSNVEHRTSNIELAAPEEIALASIS